jgi:hypothetical protein
MRRGLPAMFVPNPEDQVKPVSSMTFEDKFIFFADWQKISRDKCMQHNVVGKIADSNVLPIMLYLQLRSQLNC